MDDSVWWCSIVESRRNFSCQKFAFLVMIVVMIAVVIMLVTVERGRVQWFESVRK